MHGFSVNSLMFFSFHSCGKAFLQLWKTFTTTVKKLFHNCGKKKTKGRLQKKIPYLVKKYSD